MLLWHVVLHDSLLVELDTPLMVVLTLIVLACLPRGRISRPVGISLVVLYVSWVVVLVLL